MTRGAVAFVSMLVLVFSVTYVIAHSLSGAPAKAPRLVALPAPAVAGAPLRVSTLGQAAGLPALRRAPGDASAALASSSSPSPSPPLRTETAAD